MLHNITRRKVLASAAAGGAMALMPRAAHSQEVTLRAVSAWTEKTAFSRVFERFVEHVNETGKGKVQFQYLGGGSKIMSVFDMGQALRSGVFDVLNTTSGYYGNLMPEANAMKLKRVSYKEFRENGGYDFFNEILGQKVNAHWLGRAKGDVPFNVYFGGTVKTLDQPSFDGLKLRVSPNYRAFFSALGATLVQTQGSEIYTAMERNIVDGYGWPIQGIDELGLLPVTKKRLDPGFYVAPNEILINRDAWNKLTDDQKKVLSDAAEWVETWLDDYEEEEGEKAKKLQADNGITPIVFEGETAKAYLEAAYESGWEELLKMAPEHGPRLHSLMG
jgi:TRAP-type C4-dicarboxylate transport system substrate-binding protein